MNILIKNGILNNSCTDIYIQGNRISKIEKSIDIEADYKINAKSKAIIPGLLNCHTHAAMSLLRGFADDMPLHDWLKDKIWPLENKLTENDVYWGTKFACLEMIKTGTTFFNDMYWHWDGTAKAVEEMGLRANIAGVFIDLFDSETAKQQKLQNEKLFQNRNNFSDRIRFCLGPHAIYTVSEESLRWAHEFSRSNDLILHIHLSESQKEVDECLQKNGLTPVEYLDKIGFLGPNVVVAHGIYLTDCEIEILRDHEVKMVTNPCANMKLATGVFQFTRLKNHGITIGLGTDGVASNNNFDMFEEMKMLALLEKSRTGDPSAATAFDVFNCATSNAAKIFNIDCGDIKVGNLADLVLIDLIDPIFIPGYHFHSDMVYAANGSVVDTVICDGKILMENRKVDGEEEIIENVKKVISDIRLR